MKTSLRPSAPSAVDAFPDSYFVPEGERFISTELTRGPWSPDHQHGGPPSALMAREIERVATGGKSMQVARMTVEFLRPIPIAPLSIESVIVREGRTSQVVQCRLSAGGKDVARATALKIRTTELQVRPRHRDVVAPPPPDQSRPFEFPFFGSPVGYHVSMEGRFAKGEWGQGPATVWMRMKYPVVPGEAPSPLQRVMAAADSGNGVSVILDITKYTFINPDLTVHLFRLPRGEWVCMDAVTNVQPNGVGLADTILHDEEGPIGYGQQSLIIARRGE